tara:strand:- start:2752 stop:3012 length:261 start_codon:yes stop_codon:yes gene_type:complete
MHITIEISMYPLEEDRYIAAIQWFIERIQHYDTIQRKTTATCTQLTGDYDTLMHILQVEIKQAYQKWGQSVFVCKFIHGTLDLESV